MIASFLDSLELFLDSWELFRDAYLAGWVIAALLATMGVWVVARNQIFLGIAVSQASALGVAIALWLGAVAGHSAAEHLSHTTVWLAVAAAVVTALLTSPARRSGSAGSEALTGWVFLVAASVPVLLLSGSAHGLEEIQRLTFSTLIGASRPDLVVLGVVTAATAALAARFHQPLLLLSLDAEMAEAVGVRPAPAVAAVAAWLGLCIGLAMHVSGMLYTFGCLVLPALVARNLVREIRPLLWLSPLVALACAVAGFVLAHHFDTPPAHTTVALLGAAVPLAWLARRARAASGVS